MLKMFRLRAVLGIAILLPALAARADEAAKKGREILGKHENAILTIELVINQKFSFQGGQSQENELRTEATGTVIDEKGLTVVSLSETDPSSIMDAMLAGTGRDRGVTITAEVKDAKFLLPDGTEIPAEVILRDKDLDLAYLRPTEPPDRTFSYIDMSDSGAPELLDQVISLNRLGKVARRAPSASVERIDAIVDKPRRFYIPGRDPTNTGLGSPAFLLDGKVIGVFLVRVIKDTSGGASRMFGGAADNVLTVVVPAADIMEGAAQVPPYTD